MEIWKDIPGFEKKYGITNAAIGRVVRGTGYKDVK